MAEYKNRIKEALDIRGMKQVELVEKTGIVAPRISSWISQKWQPKADSLHLMAKALDVSELWLAGVDVPMERPIEQKKAEELADLVRELRKNEQLAIMTMYMSKLSPEQMASLLPLVKQMAETESKHE